MLEEEEKKLCHLEKRLVANVDFDDRAINSLGVGTDIYYMLGHLGWVQFSNRVSASTHKEFAMEILMTMAPIIHGGGRVSHFDWREFSKCRVTWFSKGSSGNVGWALKYDLRRIPPTNKLYREPHHPSVSLMDDKNDFRESEGNKDDRHGVELALLGFNCQATNRPLLPHDQPMVL
jgi:hypothetical protein